MVVQLTVPGLLLAGCSGSASGRHAETIRMAAAASGRLLHTPVRRLPDRWNQDGNGSPNYEMDERTFLLNRERAVDYLNMLDRLYVFDGYAGWDPEVPLTFNSIPQAFL
jgi:hypothetical protein